VSRQCPILKKTLFLTKYRSFANHRYTGQLIQEDPVGSIFSPVSVLHLAVAPSISQTTDRSVLKQWASISFAYCGCKRISVEFEDVRTRYGKTYVDVDKAVYVPGEGRAIKILEKRYITSSYSLT
jgi:hypothetical protein